jgi:hypothetical protein
MNSQILNDADLDAVSGGDGWYSNAELIMLDRQSLVSKRGTAVQFTTGMMNSMNGWMKSVAGNVGR